MVGLVSYRCLDEKCVEVVVAMGVAFHRAEELTKIEAPSVGAWRLYTALHELYRHLDEVAALKLAQPTERRRGWGR